MTRQIPKLIANGSRIQTDGNDSERLTIARMESGALTDPWANIIATAPDGVELARMVKMAAEKFEKKCLDGRASSRETRADMREMLKAANSILARVEGDGAQ